MSTFSHNRMHSSIPVIGEVRPIVSIPWTSFLKTGRTKMIAFIYPFGHHFINTELLWVAMTLVWVTVVSEEALCSSSLSSCGALIDWFYHAHLNYSDMNVSLSKKSPANRLFVQQFVQTDRMEKTPKLRITALLWGETTGDLWILPAKGKSLGERFHFIHHQVLAQCV